MNAPAAFDPHRVLIDWKDNAGGFTIADATTGVCVMGATGSGKTSGPGQLLARAYLRAGFGGLVLCAKVDERAQWEAWVSAAGRSKDLVIVDTTGQHAFNFLEWEASRADSGGGFTINVVALLDEIAGAIDSGGGSGAGDGGGDNAFFRSALRHMLANLVELPILAKLPVSLPLLRAIANSAPLSLAQRDDPEWQKTSACWRILREAEAATKDDPDAERDYEECRSYWEIDHPALSDRTRSIITLMFGMLVRPFITRPLRKLFSEDTTITPEDAFKGKIIIVDLPVQDYRLAGRVAALAWKWCFQVAVMRRQFDGGERRPVFLWADEAQNFVTERDAEYQAVARSAGGCTVYLTQQREGLRRVLRSDDATDNLLANLQTKFFCQNSGETNTWASGLLGERFVKITSTNVGRSGQSADSGIADAHGQAGIQRSEQRRHFIEPSRFTTLKRGGPANDFQVEAVAYCGGKLFDQGAAESLPFKLLTFRQR
jgi:TraM recognition site of TraD and TraG